MAVAITREEGHELILTRTFDASPDLVFKAWTNAKYLAQWWGPKGFTNPVCEIDPHPGGRIRIHMRAPDGTVYPMTGVFDEVVEPTSLVFTSSALDDTGNPIFEVETTVTFAPTDDGKTLLTMQARVTKTTANASQYLAGMEIGWTQSFDRLADLLTKSKS
jgi:uncharacterized protein YndB with AHSA1/START domain